jgi:hypothetical protein
MTDNWRAFRNRAHRLCFCADSPCREQATPRPNTYDLWLAKLDWFRLLFGHLFFSYSARVLKPEYGHITIKAFFLRWRSRGVPLFLLIIEARIQPGYYPLQKRDGLLATSVMVRLPVLVLISVTTVRCPPRPYVKEPL